MPLMARLTGQELLEYAQANEGLPLDDLVKGAGYYREIIGEGDEVKVQLNRQPFWKALAVAQGIISVPVSKQESRGGGKGRERGYRVKSNAKSGNIVITGSYLEEIGGQPGDYFKLEVVADTGELVVVREEGEQASPDDLTAKANVKSKKELVAA